MFLSPLTILRKLKNVFLQQSRGQGSWILGIDQGTAALRYVVWDRKENEVIAWGAFEVERQDAEKGKGGQDTAAYLREIARIIPKHKIYAVHFNLQGGPLLLGFLDMAAGAKVIPPGVFLHALRPHIPFPTDDAAFFYREAFLNLPAQTDRKALVNYAACHKPVIAKMTRLTQSIFGLVPDVTTQGYAHEVLSKYFDPAKIKGLTAIIGGGRSITSISILKDGQLVFEREVPLAGQDITRSVFIMYLQGQTLRSADDLKLAEQLKRKSTLPFSQVPGGGDESVADANNQKLYQSIQGVLSAWVQDIRLSFAYFNEHYDSSPIQTIYIAGGMANHGHLEDYLSRELGINVFRLQYPLDRLKIAATAQPKEGLIERFHEYAPALGLALKPPMQFSLTPRDYYAADWAKIWQALLRVFVLIACVFLSAAFLFLQTQENRLQSVKQTVDTHRQFLGKLEGPYQEMLRWGELLKRAEFPTPRAADFLQAIARVAPRDLVLSSLSYDRQTGQILLEGVIYGDPAYRGVMLAEFTKVFKRDPRFDKVEVPIWDSLSSEESKGRFRLAAHYKIDGRGEA